MPIVNQGSDALALAVGWLQQALLGSLATAIAVIAVASVGFLALSGRVDLRRGVTVILGCFILFGAPGIVAGLQTAIASGADGTTRRATPPPPPAFQPPPRQPTEARPYDPYAGAAVPVQ